MPLLKIKRQELFAQSVASGNNLLHAAIAAGYSQHSAQTTASTLAKVPKVAARIEELTKDRETAIRLHSSYSVRDALRETDEALEIARQKRNGAAMVGAVQLKAKLAGLLVEKRSIEYKDMSALSNEELDMLIDSVEQPEVGKLRVVK